MTPRNACITIAAVALSVGAGNAGIARAEPPGQILTRLSGTWTGNGQVTFEKGQTEQLVCRAYYATKSERTSMGLAIRCASASYKFEMRATLNFEGTQVSGSWEERTFNAAGTVEGSVGESNLQLAIAGVLSGAMSVKVDAAGHRVDFRPRSADGLKTVAINFART